MAALQEKLYLWQNAGQTFCLLSQGNAGTLECLCMQNTSNCSSAPRTLASCKLFKIVFCMFATNPMLQYNYAYSQAILDVSDDHRKRVKAIFAVCVQVALT